MGSDVDRIAFTADDFRSFDRALTRGLRALDELLARPRFGEGAPSIGAELEFFLIGDDGRPRGLSRQVLRDTLDPRLALEIDRFNLEYNARPRLLTGAPFSALGAELGDAMGAIGTAAAAHDGRVAAIGILPTLRREDLTAEAMTDQRRFRALAAGIRRSRQRPLEVDIRGEREAVQAECDEVTLEGANTALQVHLRVPPLRFAAIYNAAQLATGPVLALAGNSPIFLGCRLWDETRIALFRQAVDERDAHSQWRPTRVSFGHGWVRESASEIFAEAVALHAPLLPIVSDEDPEDALATGGVPQLAELRLHAGTVWTWNRPVYDPTDGGHLRIEFRALPAGPSVIDMVANSAFLVGLTLALAPRMSRFLPAMPFRYAHDNFYEAARLGLDAVLLWPSLQPPSPQRVGAADLLPDLLTEAQGGLVDAGVDEAEAARMIGICRERLARRQTGARWQAAMLDALERDLTRCDALATMLEAYLKHAQRNVPVHDWPVGN